MGHLSEANPYVVTGIGITSAIGQGKEAFVSSLLHAKHSFDTMKRPGRIGGTAYIGAEIADLTIPAEFSKKLMRTVSHSEQAALVTLHEAWKEAGLDTVDPERIGLIVGGSNLQLRHAYQLYHDYSGRMDFINPTYGFTFMDSDVCGLCTELFGIKGLAYTVGGASASGQLAVIQAIQALETNQIDVCIALGGLMDLSIMEIQALRSLGAMGSDRFSNEPAEACRPFDKNHDGFIYGESCGAVVIEKAVNPFKRPVKHYGSITGWGMGVDGNRNPNPSFEGECRVINNALKSAGLQPQAIDYINPHGTGSLIGDETELKAIEETKLSHAYINATKSITGHGLSAAGTVEVIATLLQMEASSLHPTRNLVEPINTRLNFVMNKPVSHSIKNALSLSMGFGGINTAICLKSK